MGIARWEGRALVVRYQIGEAKLPAMLKRTLVDEQVQLQPAMFPVSL